MRARHTDPLLAVARAICWFFVVTLSIVAVLVTIGIPLAAFNTRYIVAELARDGVVAGPEVTAAIAILLAGILGFLLLAVWFLRLLLRIIDTVGEGDPFLPVNAARLNRMAWLSLSSFLLSLPVGALAMWLGNSTDGNSGVWDFDFGATVLLALVLFILARVFKLGAAMRDDLEGTV